MGFRVIVGHSAILFSMSHALGKIGNFSSFLLSLDSKSIIMLFMIRSHVLPACAI